MSKRMNFPHRRKQRRDEAAVRQDEYDALTVDQRIERARSRPGNSERELNRLRAS